jgi:uncharacterized protein YyaL (SSP411 family)
MLASIGPTANRYPTAFANWLSGYDFALAKVREVAMLLPASHSGLSDFTDIIWREFRPNLVMAASRYPVEDESPAILHNRELIDDSITIYVCENFFCLHPVTTPEALSKQLLQSPG